MNELVFTLTPKLSILWQYLLNTSAIINHITYHGMVVKRLTVTVLNIDMNQCGWNVCSLLLPSSPSSHITLAKNVMAFDERI
jgi:hypothetical protein